MLDLQYLRDHHETYKAAASRKKFSFDLDRFLALDTQRREALTAAEEARASQRAANQEMAALKKGSPEFMEKVAAMKSVAAKVKDLDAAAKSIEGEWREVYLTLPNFPDESVPSGRGEEDNQTVSEVGDCGEEAFPNAQPHWDIPSFNKMADFGRGTKVTGAGFPFFTGEMAQLIRALLHFFLKKAGEAGYEEVACPLMVNPASAMATGQLPDKEGQMYHVVGEDLYLIPTAEVPLTNFFRDEIIPEGDLPLKRCGYTPCFRREAGSWGKDVRGLNRLHQFDKVEVVQWVAPEDSAEALEGLRKHAESILQELGLPYRVLLICSGDIGFPHSKQYDLEVWAAGQKRWLEVSSCSNFTDFQARRANIRFRRGEAKPEFVHTLNGSALAIPRVLAAILENNLQADGSIHIPEALRPFLGFEQIAAQ